MPPIRQIDDAFLSSLLEDKQDYIDLKTQQVDAASLTAILQKLNTTSDALRQELFEQVHTNWSDFSAWYNTSQTLHASVLELIKQASHTQQQAASTQTQVDETMDTYQRALAASTKNKLQMDVLEHLEHALQIVEAIESELQQYSYLNAVQHVLKLATVLKEWTHAAADPRVLEMVQQRVEQLKQTLITCLYDGLHTAIQCTPGSIRMLETYSPSTSTLSSSSKQVHIRDILEGLFLLGLLPEAWMAVQRSILKSIFKVYFDCVHCTLEMDPVDMQESQGGHGGILRVVPATSTATDDDGDDDGHVDPIVMLQHMEAILDFIYTHTWPTTAPHGSNDTEMKRLFGNLLMPDLVDLMIQKSIAPAVPSTKYNLQDFSPITHAVKQFEAHCKDNYGFQLDDLPSLGTYVDNLDKHYATKRRNHILQEGRKVMLRQLYATESTSVRKDDDGHTYHYHITQTPQILAVLVSDTLAEGTDLQHTQHPVSAATLMDGIQDLLDMYRAIMPSFHRTQYLASPGNALVFRNDCFWLAHQLTNTTALATPQVKQLFPTLNAGLVQAATRLRELGNAWHEWTLMQRVQQIQAALDRLDGFSGMAENAKFQHDCESAISHVIDLVGSFAQETQPVIDETLFLDMLGRMVDSVLARLIHDMEALMDIGAQESHIIARTLNSLAQLVNAFDLPGKDATEAFVVELVPNWQKFWLVKDILEMNMREIMEAFRRGDLHMFEKSELVGLLCALFADTELREANIQEIKTGTPSLSYQSNTTTTRHQPPQQHQQQQQRTSTASANVPATTFTPSIHQALVYTPDNDDEETLKESGWGDDDDDMDLFAQHDDDGGDNSDSSRGLVNNNNNNHHHQTVSQISLEPSPNLEYDLADPNTSTGVHGEEPDGEGGWGDADQDIFMEEENDDALDSTITKEQSAGGPNATTMTAAADHDAAKTQQSETTSRLIPSTSDTNSPPHATHLLAAPALDLDTEEGDGWGGWNDEDDEDLFKD